MISIKELACELDVDRLELLDCILSNSYFLPGLKLILVQQKDGSRINVPYATTQLVNDLRLLTQEKIYG